jgi:hypothetical protein
MTLFHPRQRTLVAFALGDLEKRARVARHLERCSSCRQFVGFTQRLSAAVSTRPAPAPRDDILARALADRARGERFIVGEAMTMLTKPSSWRAGRSLILVAASLIIAIATISQLRRGDFRGANELLLAGIVPKNAQAGQGGTAGGALMHRLRPMAVTYQRQIIDSATGRATDWGVLDINIKATGVGAWQLGSAWRQLERVTDMDGARAWAETVTVADSSLAPSRRVVHVTPYRRWDGILIDQSFRNDSVVGQMSLDNDPTRRPIARDLSSARDRLVASDALSPFWLMGVPLVIGTEVDVNVLGWSVVPNDVMVALHMKVVGSERIETPAGTFDCWKLAIQVANQTHYYWVRKSDHLGVLSRRRLPNGNTRQVILTREQSNK